MQMASTGKNWVMPVWPLLGVNLSCCLAGDPLTFLLVGVDGKTFVGDSAWKMHTHTHTHTHTQTTYTCTHTHTHTHRFTVSDETQAKYIQLDLFFTNRTSRCLYIFCNTSVQWKKCVPQSMFNNQLDQALNVRETAAGTGKTWKPYFKKKNLIIKHTVTPPPPPPPPHPHQKPSHY